MSSETVTQWVERLARAQPLTAERFAALLGVPLKTGDTNPYWQGYTFDLAGGPFAGGELRLDTDSSGALLTLEPRDPPGLGEADVDRAAFGTRLSIRPNPDIPPEGTISEYYKQDGVEVVLQWTGRSYRLRMVVLNWARPVGAEGSAGAG